MHPALEVRHTQQLRPPTPSPLPTPPPAGDGAEAGAEGGALLEGGASGAQGKGAEATLLAGVLTRDLQVGLGRATIDACVLY